MGASQPSELTPQRLDDNPDAVTWHPKPRSVQDRGTSYDVSLVMDWARLLNLDNQSTPVNMALVDGTQPVVIEEKVILIKPHPQYQHP